MPPRSPSDAAAAEVLRDYWGIALAPHRAAEGASRNTWRVDGRFWLSHSDATQEASFRREARLLEALSMLLTARKTGWRVPDVVSTASGESVAVTRDGVWRLARHVHGEQPDMRDGDTYLVLARMLAQSHEVLRSVPHSLKVRDLGAVERAQAIVTAFDISSFRPATGDARELPAIGRIVDWLRPRIGELASLPRQLVHGDWTPPNIKARPESWTVLDWEFARLDPPVMDLAQSCSTILIWSGLNAPAEHVSRLVETYRRHSGLDVAIETVRVAMAAYWLQNYGHWRCRQETVGGFEDVLATQPGRLVAIAEFIGAP